MSPQFQSVYFVDDDIFHRINWQRYLCHSFQFHSFSSVSELLKTTQELKDKDSALIVVDFELEDGSNFVSNCARILNNGFKKIFVSTAYHCEQIEVPSGVLGVIGKIPPDWMIKALKQNSKPEHHILTKLTSSERCALLQKLSESEKIRLRTQLGEYYIRCYGSDHHLDQGPWPEMVMNTWERAIFEGVNENELSLRLEKAWRNVREDGVSR